MNTDTQCYHMVKWHKVHLHQTLYTSKLMFKLISLFTYLSTLICYCHINNFIFIFFFFSYRKRRFHAQLISLWAKSLVNQSKSKLGILLVFLMTVSQLTMELLLPIHDDGKSWHFSLYWRIQYLTHILIVAVGINLHHLNFE